MSNSDETLRDLVFAALNEQRAKRRWGIFFKSLFFLWLFLIAWLLWPKSSNVTSAISTPHTALIDINGEISSDEKANADDIISSLDKAFKDSGTKGVILRIDSPGGSPVQANYVYDEIMRQRQLHPDIKVYAVCTDMCASAAYYIASAANDIYASPDSIVGSIGVLIDGFGFTDAMQKLGIDRRLIISGYHKNFLDPFSPLSPDDAKIAQSMLDGVHDQFIQKVMAGRGNRLKINNDTFSGLAWTGQQALGLGVIDGYGSAQQVAREVIKAEKITNYTVKTDVFDQLADKIGASFALHVAEELGMQNHGLQARMD